MIITSINREQEVDLEFLPRGAKKMIITSINREQKVDLEFVADIADQVRAIEAAAYVNEDGVIQAWDAVPLFPGRPEFHTTMSEYAALIAAGCTPIEDKD